MECIVRGRVIDAQGRPVVGVTVELFERRLLGDIGLKAVSSGAGGIYEIAYSPGVESPDIYVRATWKGMDFATSPVVIGAAEIETLDLLPDGEEYRGPSEFEQIEARLSDVMTTRGSKLEKLGSLEDRDFGYLSVRSGIEPVTLRLFQKSMVLENATGIRAYFFFGLGRQGIAVASMSQIGSHGASALREALERAIDANQIPSEYAKNIGPDAELILTRSVEDFVFGTGHGSDSNLKTLLETVGIGSDKAVSLAERYIRHEGTAPDFWRRVESEKLLEKKDIQNAQVALQLGSLTRFNVPFVRQLQEYGVNQAKDLARFEKSDWVDFAKRHGVPESLEGAVDADEYGELLYESVEEAFPSARLAWKLEGMGGRDVQPFFDRFSDLNLRDTPIEVFLAENPYALNDALPHLSEEDARARLKEIERTYRLSSPGRRLDSMQVLLDKKLNSAQKIRALGKPTFLEEVESQLGLEEAERIYERANKIHAAAAALMARHGRAFNHGNFAVIADLADLGSVSGEYGAKADGGPTSLALAKGGEVAVSAEATKQLPDWESLFGSLDFCSCSECQSVFGPAAYLVDLLHFLSERKATGGRTLLQLMEDRRSDIAGIELSCHNTNTALPYIDLVNEVLELQVDPSGSSVGYQTRGEHLDLAAHPENVRESAYSKLAVAPYPFELPFDLWGEEARTYLSHLGVDRSRLMEGLFEIPQLGLFDKAVAAELLGLSLPEFDLIAGSKTIGGTTYTTPKFWNVPSWNSLLDVEVLLNKARQPDGQRMSFEDLADVLRTRFVQGTGTKVSVWFGGAPCDLGLAKLQGANEETFERMHRFIRLQRRIGLSAADLDRAIELLGGNRLDLALLLGLALLKRGARELNVSLSDALNFIGPLDTKRWKQRLRGMSDLIYYDAGLTPTPSDLSDTSFYDRLFLNRSVGSTAEPAFGVQSSGTEIVGASGNHRLDQYYPNLAGALGVSASDIELVATKLVDQTLNLENLSILYRYVWLARTLSMSISELVSLLDLTGNRVIKQTGMSICTELLQLVEDLRRIRDSDNSPNELRYLLLKNDPSGVKFEPSPVAIGVALRDLRDLVLKFDSSQDGDVEEEDLSIADLRVRLRGCLAQLMPSSKVNEAIGLADPGAGFLPPTNPTTFITEQFSRFLVAEEAVQNLVRGDLTEPEDRLLYLLGNVSAYLDRTAPIVQKIASAFDLDVSIVAPLIRRFVGIAPTKVVDLFLANELLEFEGTADAPVPSPERLPLQFRAYKKLHKIATILKQFELHEDELEWLFESAPSRSILRLDDLQTSSDPSGDAQRALYRSWSRLVDVIDARDRVLGGRLIDLFAETDFPKVKREIALRAGWNFADFEYACQHLRVDSGSFWKDEQNVLRADRLMAICRSVGLPMWTIAGWSHTISASHTREIKQAVRARYDKAQWKELAPAIREGLRERQRDALVGWLVGNKAEFSAGPNALFHHLLLDVEMSACQMTSRIKQAISSVQLFVQQVLMNLETEASKLGPAVAADLARQWEWRKNYRVWEANRKVFLYPENFIEPELRDDKTPFFRDLEAELLQGEVTQDSAERAVLSYLEKLEDVSRLEIMAFCEQEGTTPQDTTLHVFGRTRGQPHRYYYRQRIGSGRWTPWEKIDLDIEGDHLVPFFHNRRLYLFWPMFSEGAVEEMVDTPSASQQAEDGNANNTGKAPTKYYQVALAWTERRFGKWAKKNVSKDRIGDVRRSASFLEKTAGSTTAKFVFQPTPSANGRELFVSVMKPGVRATSSIGANGEQESHSWEVDDSLVCVGQFRLTGADGTVVTERGSTDELDIALPKGSVLANQRFVWSKEESALSISAPKLKQGDDESPTLMNKVKSPFEVVPLRPCGVIGATPFFFQDRNRTYFLEPIPEQQVPDQGGMSKPEFTTVDVRTNEPAGLEYTFNVQLNPLVPVHNPNPMQMVAFPSLVADKKPDLGMLSPNLWEASTKTASINGVLVSPAKQNETKEKFITMDFGSPQTLKGMRALSTTQTTTTEGYKNGNSGFPNLDLGSTGGTGGSGGTEGTFGTGTTGSTGFTVVPASTKTVETINVYVPPIVGSDPPPVLKLTPYTRFRLSVFYHPFVPEVRAALDRDGVNGLWDAAAASDFGELRRQIWTNQGPNGISNDYAPTPYLGQFPSEIFDFDANGSYSNYNWELFFHIPFLIATNLGQNRRFDEALRWFHYIFDPTEPSTNLESPQRFWKVGPFYNLFHRDDESASPIHQLVLLLAERNPTEEQKRVRKELETQIKEWSRDPFNPHVIARLRLTAFQKAVVMKYVDTLIEWGDELFRRDTLESLNEATLFYVLAAEILGRRPEEVRGSPSVPVSFEALRSGLDALSNIAIRDLEGYLRDMADSEGGEGFDAVPNFGLYQLFCVPANDRMVSEYWDRVADRLFKIRHCMNIDGVVRQLPLFEPPIDPALLVRATAAGLDLGSVLNDMNAPLPNHRFQIIAGKATELCGEVKSLGAALLSALEKKDAENLAVLKAGQETKIHAAVRAVRKQQIQEAQETLEGVKRSKENAKLRLDYYRSRKFMSSTEKLQQGLLITSAVAQTTAQGIDFGVSLAGATPTISAGVAGFGGSPTVLTEFGGQQIGSALKAVADGFRMAASIAGHGAQMAGLAAGYERRNDDWKLQASIAAKEIEGLDKQIIAAEIRVAMAENELDNLDQQIEFSKESEDFLKSKYTNQQLYQWMVGQLSTLYFQSYKLAYDLAKRAEKAWQHETGAPSKKFIFFGHWDGLKKGLLAGERLYQELKQMEVAFLDNQKREYELTRHFSVRMLDPVALQDLRETGECIVRIPEEWFDLDSPGHYFRRIKSVSLSIPSVTGPYAPVRCTLTLLSNRMRTGTGLISNKYAWQNDSDARFSQGWVGNQSIVTSRAQEDSGLFEVNLHDERYLPFEGAGAISEWRLELPTNFPQFPYDTISDAIIHMRYTAREGGSAFRGTVESELLNSLRALVPHPEGEPGLLQEVEVSRDFPDAWAQFIQRTGLSLTLPLEKDLLPYSFQGGTPKVSGVTIVVDIATTAPATQVVIRDPGGSSPPIELVATPGRPNRREAVLSFDQAKSFGTWTFEFSKVRPADLGSLEPSAFSEMSVLVRYKP